MQYVYEGTTAKILVQAVDDNGDHVAATIDTTLTRLQKGTSADTTWNSAAPTVSELGTGRYLVTFSGLSPELEVAHNDDHLRCEVGGTIAGVSFTLFAIPLECRIPNTSFSRLGKSAGQIIPGTVEDSTTTPTTTTFAAADITEATADHFNGRIIIFTSGALAGQATDITDYELDSGEGKFVVTALTEAPADGDTFVIV